MPHPSFEEMKHRARDFQTILDKNPPPLFHSFLSTSHLLLRVLALVHRQARSLPRLLILQTSVVEHKGEGVMGGARHEISSPHTT